MRYVSTRGGVEPVGFSTAVRTGLAPDGGLWMPERLPEFAARTTEGPAEPAALARAVLAPFLGEDPLGAALEDACARAFSIEIPLTALHGRPDVSVLELFHGPTAAFKDFGARFFAACLERLAAGRGASVLVATSGDTGGAVAAALHRSPGIRVGVLFPAGRISADQLRQIAGFDDNVTAFAVRGSFDDCQRLLKEALADPSWQARGLTTANSVNIARLLPQIVYHAHGALRHLARCGEAPGLIVPTGNLGNALAASMARRMGFPIREVVIVTNANRLVVDWLQGAKPAPRPAVRTLANAMDVGWPSNLERLRWLFPDFGQLRGMMRAFSVSDAEIARTIRSGPARHRRIWDPHTAAAVHVLDELPPAGWVVCATAHPAKFRDVVAPLAGVAPEPPPALAEMLARPSRWTEIEPTLAALEEAWR